MKEEREQPLRGEASRGLSRLLSGPAGLRIHALPRGTSDLVLLSFPVPAPELPADLEGRLSPSQREVARGMLAGLTNAQIARDRGVSVRTVANQAAQIFKTLGISSRVELAALCAPR